MAASLTRGLNNLRLSLVSSSNVSYVRYKHYKRSWTVEEKNKEERDLSWAHPLLEWPEERKSMQEKPVSPLHMVQRIKHLSGRPYWERKLANELGIGEETKRYQKVILKNTYQTNQKLKNIKHLIQITPVTFPYGLPEDESDYEHCYLRDNGEFIVKKKISCEESKELATTLDRDNQLWSLDSSTLKKHVEKKAADKDFSSEYFKPNYQYTQKPNVNETVNEDRYFKDKARRSNWQ